MITKFFCDCGANKPEDAKFYDGCLGYEAIVCKRCGRYYDHEAEHQANDWSRAYVKGTLIFPLNAFGKQINTFDELSEYYMRGAITQVTELSRILSERGINLTNLIHSNKPIIL